MRVDCFNACECELSELLSGDTFYLDGALYLKAYMESTAMADGEYVVDLARGEIMVVLKNTIVQKADTKVVAYNGN